MESKARRKAEALANFRSERKMPGSRKRSCQEILLLDLLDVITIEVMKER